MKKYVYVLFVLCIGLLLACSNPESSANIIQERVPAAQSISIKEDIKNRTFYVGDTFNLYKDFYTITPASATITPEVKILEAEETVSFNKSTGEFKCLKAGKVHVTLTVDNGVMSSMSVSTSIDVKEKETTPAPQNPDSQDPAPQDPEPEDPKPHTPEEEFVGQAKLVYDEKEIIADSNGKYLLNLVKEGFDKVEGFVLSALLKVETAVKGTEYYQNDLSYTINLSAEEVLSFYYATQTIMPVAAGECCLTVESNDEKWEDISFNIIVKICEIEDIKNGSDNFPDAITLYTGISEYSFAPAFYPEYAICGDVITEYDDEYLSIVDGVLYPKKLTEKTTIKLSSGSYSKEINVQILDGIDTVKVTSFAVTYNGERVEIADFSNLTLFMGSDVNLVIEVVAIEGDKAVSFRIESDLNLTEVYSSAVKFTLSAVGKKTFKIIPECDSSKYLQLDITVVDFVPLESVSFVDKTNKLINLSDDELSFDLFSVDVSPASYTASHYEINYLAKDASEQDASEYITFADGKVNLADDIPVGVYTIYVKSSNGKQDGFELTVIDKKFLKDYSFTYLTDNDGNTKYVELNDKSNLFETAISEDINTVEIKSSSDIISVDSIGNISFDGVGEGTATIKIETSYNNFSEYTFNFVIINPINTDDINLEISDVEGEEYLYILKVSFNSKSFELENLSITGDFVVTKYPAVVDNYVTLTICFEAEGSHDITIRYTNITQTGVVSITDSVAVATPVAPEPEISTDISGILFAADGGEYTMTSDISLPADFTTILEFKGTLNGNGYTMFNLHTTFISNLMGNINNVTFCAGYSRVEGKLVADETPILVETSSAVLCITNSGSINGVSLYTNAKVASEILRFGVLVYSNQGSVMSTHVYGSINVLGGHISGFVHEQKDANSTIGGAGDAGCSVTLHITVPSTYSGRVGGFIYSIASGKVENCQANITFSGGGSNLGGFIYSCATDCDATIKDSTVKLYIENGAVKNCKIFAYSLLGDFNGSIRNCLYLDIPGYDAYDKKHSGDIDLEKLTA